MWPKPIQNPHPPIILGGAVGKKTAQHIAEFCDGWMPLGRYGDVKRGLNLIKDAAAKIGRNLDNFELSMFCFRDLSLCLYLSLFWGIPAMSTC